MRVEFRIWEDPAPDRPRGKVVLRPETPEELAELDAFRRHVGRHTGGDRFEIVFFPKRPGRRAEGDGQEARPGAAAGAGETR